MSKQLYEEIQEFLADKWGPMGGWTQAVMFAADLPMSTSTPQKNKTTPKKEIVGTLQQTTPTQKSTKISKREVLRSLSQDSPSKVKVEVIVKEEGEEKGNGKRSTQGDLPAIHGFKRTRSTARIELSRTSSSVTSVADGVKDLDVG
jgi:N-glycosylase/DNA lyase